MSRRMFRSLAMAQQQPPTQPPQAQPSKPPTIPPMVDEKYGTAARIMSLPAAELIAIVKDPAASEYAKAKACQRLAVIGGKSAVAPLAALLEHPRLSHYARYALEPNPDPAADDALRAALGKLQGKLLVGVINSIAQRRDRGAISALARLRFHEDREVAGAAEAALARIRPPV